MDATGHPSTSGPLSDSGHASHRLRLALVRLARQVRQHAQPGMTPTRYSMLALLSRAGPMRPAELAEKEQIARSTVTKLVGHLEDAGLVERSPDPADGRACLLSTTVRGEEFLADSRQRASAFLARRIDEAGLSEADIVHTCTVLESLWRLPR